MLRVDLTITGQPTASALDVSVPTTEMAKGKLHAPITATGPIGMFSRNMEGLGRGSMSRPSFSCEKSFHDSLFASFENSLI